MDQSVKVSVIIPTYKRSAYLKRAVESALSQTYRNIEILVVDDNGMDTVDGNHVAALMRQFSFDPRVRYLQNAENMGGAVARNIGIHSALGDYISFLDDDDEFLPEKTEAQLSFMKAHKLDVCLVDMAGYNENGEQISEKHHAFPENPTRENLLVAHLLHHLTGTPSLMFRADALRKIGGFSDLPAMHEYLLMLKAIEAGLTIGHLPEMYTKVQAHSSGRVSMSVQKMRVLSLLLETKRGYFHLLLPSQRRYILSKHHGTVFYLRYLRGEYVRAFCHLAASILYSPNAFWDSFLEKKGKFFALRRTAGAAKSAQEVL